jgi:metallo-beta-lactamase class B
MKLNFISSSLLFLLLVQSLFAQQTEPIYRSETLEIKQISPNTFVHVSYLNTQDFGKVGCNGMIVINEGEALVFDTPTDDTSSGELIQWLETKKNVQVKAVLATHFHNDCVGGLKAFHAKGVPSYGSFKTIALAKSAGDLVPENGFENELNLQAGGLQVVSRFFGEGHTRDNVVAYVPADQVLFGGCLIKEVGATVGYLGDANTGAWSETVSRVKTTFPEVQTVIPGHGKIGNGELLDYTIRLFEGK